MKPDGLPAPLSPRRHPPLTAPKPDPRTVARLTDAAGWTSKKPITFDAAI